MKVLRPFMILILVLALPLLFIACVSGDGSDGTGDGDNNPDDGGGGAIASVNITGRVIGISGASRAGSAVAVIIIPADGVTKKAVIGNDGSFSFDIATGTTYIFTLVDADAYLSAVIWFGGKAQMPCETSTQASIDLGMITLDPHHPKATVGYDPVAAGVVSGSVSANLGKDSDSDGLTNVAVAVTTEGVPMSGGKVAGGTKYRMADYWPLAISNSWTYSQTGALSTYTENIYNTEVVNGVEAFRITNNNGTINYYSVVDGAYSHPKQTGSASTGTWTYLYTPPVDVFPAEFYVGSWIESRSAYTYTDSGGSNIQGTYDWNMVVEDTGYIDSSAGQFDDCVLMSVYALDTFRLGDSIMPYTDTYLSKRIYCKGVGMAYINGSNAYNNGTVLDYTRELTGYSVR